MLYVVSTPIGNLEDITLRALRILKEVDLIACEDTRITQRLLQRYKINKPLISYHQHSKIQKVKYLINLLKQEKNIALVSDAGTPGISDPGNVLVKEVLKNDLGAVPIPGPSALLCACQAAGIPTSNFLFLGFLPHKNKRQKILEEIKKETRPVILYESCHRINKLLQELGDKEVIIARELTKIHEQFLRGKASTLKPFPKGEFVVIVLPHPCLPAGKDEAIPPGDIARLRRGDGE